MASDPESLATKLERAFDALPVAPSERHWRDFTAAISQVVAGLRSQPPVLSVEGLREKVEALHAAPVPPTIATDDEFRDIYCQGYRHALSDVLAILAAPVETAELDRLRNLCAEMYQVAGTLGADARVLDNLSAAANGQPLPHETLLPYAAPVKARAPQCQICPRLQAKLDANERQHLQTIDERDNAQEWADKLAYAIGGEEIGEHSIANNPWANALDLAEARAPHEAPAGLTFESLKATNRQRCEQAFHDVDEWKPWEWSNAMAGECGEACNITKKMARIWPANQFKQNWNKPEDQRMAELESKLADELADVVIYADLLATRIGRSLGECVRHKFNEKSDEIGSPVKLAALRAPQPAEPTREVLHAATCKGLLYPGLRECTCGGPAYIRSLKAQVATLTTERDAARSNAEGWLGELNASVRRVSALTTEVAEARSVGDRAEALFAKNAELTKELAAALKLADSNLHPGRYPDPAFTVEGGDAEPSHMHALVTALSELLKTHQTTCICAIHEAARAALAASEPASKPEKE